MDIDDQGTPQSEGHGLQEPLDDARQRVEELEAVGVVARGAIPGFDAALEAARSRLEHLQRLRKASRPVHWRLVEARRRARIKADALEKARADSARIHREYEVVQARLAAQEAEVATAMEALSEADRAVAAVVNEIAGEATMGCGGAAADALAVAEGLVTQVGALSGALGSDNVESGVAAIQAQLAALLRELRGSRIAAEPPPVVLVPDERLQEDGYEGGEWRAALGLIDVRDAEGFDEVVRERGLGSDMRCQWQRWRWASDGAHVAAVEVFTDGAAELTSAWPRQVRSAGWGAVVLSIVVQDGQPTERHLLGCLYGPVIIGRGEDGHMGADRPSAPAAELSAIMAVHRLSLALRPAAAQVSIRSDSTYALGIVQFRARAQTGVPQVLAARRWAMAAAATMAYEYQHVRGHSGVAGNELADVAAEFGRRGRVSCREAFCRLGGDATEAAFRSTAPRISLDSLLFWTAVLQEADPKEQQAAGHGRADLGRYTLVVATANVLTLHPGQEADGEVSLRRAHLANRFAEIGLCIVGIQEGRSRESVVRETGAYHMCVGAADSSGVGGVELWLHAGLGYIKREVVPLYSDPRRLLVRAVVRGELYLFVVGHAPCTAAGEQEVRRWWRETASLVEQRAPKGAAIIGLFDANARVGSVTSPFVGGTEGEEENYGGECLHAFLEKFDLAAPSTFSGGGPTWVARTGKEHRLDYVMLPRAWLGAVVGTCTDAGGLLVLGDYEDHRVAVAEVIVRSRRHRGEGGSGSASTGGGWVDRRPAIASRAALRLPPVRDGIEQAWLATPPLPQQWSAELMERALARRGRQLWAAHCPLGPAAPRAEWISAETWACMRAHAAVRRLFFVDVRRRAKTRKAYFFARWAGAAVAEKQATYARRAAEAVGQDTELTALLTYRAFGLRAAATEAAEGARRDRSAWLERKADAIAADLREGRTASLWRLVRQLAGKRSGARRKTLAVVTDREGNVVDSPEAMARMWQQRFLDEFSGRGDIVDESTYFRDLGHIERHPLGHDVSDDLDVQNWAGLLVDALAGLGNNRAVGDDLLPAEFLKAGGVGYVRQLATLTAKAAATTIPSGWRGGMMIPVPKKPKLPMDFKNSRGVLCSDHAGKAVARVVRRHLAPALTVAAGPLQHGGVKGGGTEYPSHAARLFLKSAQLSGKSACVLFTDLRAAFYSVLPELALGALMPRERRVGVLRSIGFSDRAIANYEAKVFGGNQILAQQGVEAKWRLLAADWHRESWFGVMGSSRRVRAFTGTRPGDPLADLVFNLTFLEFQRDLQEAIKKASLDHVLSYKTGGIFAQGENGEVEVPTVSFMDDLAILVEEEDPETLLDSLALLTGVVTQLAAEHGLELNLAAGKTEAILRLAGAGAGAAKARLREAPAQQGGPGVALLPLADGTSLRIVPSYKHLGVMTAAGRAKGREIAARTRSAHAATAALFTRVLGNGKYTEKARVRVAAACVHTRCLYQASTWEELTAEQRRRLSAAWMRPLCRVDGSLRAPAAGEHLPTHAETRAKLGVPPLSAALAVEVLRYAAKVTASGPAYLHALLQSPAGEAWRGRLLRSMRMLWRALGPKVADLGEPQTHPERWEKFWREWPRQWAQLLRCYLQRTAREQKDFADDHSEGGDPSDGEFLCITCGAEFCTLTQLKCHRIRAHGVRREARHFVLGPICPACGGDYRSRLRAMKHMERGALACQLALHSGALPRHSEEAVAAADAADTVARRTARAAGLCPEAGPPALKAPAG